MPVVTISRQFGAGGHTLGKNVAESLGYQLIDRSIIHQVAREANVSEAWVEAVEKDAGGLLMRMVGKLVSSDFIERHLGETGSDFDEAKYIRFVKKIIKDLAELGDVVIVGRGSQFILPDSERIIKVLLVAEFEDRIRFMMDQYRLTRARAEQVVHREEKRRLTFLKLFDPRDPDDPGFYSVVLNTSRLSLEEAHETIMDLVGLVIDEYARPIW